MFEGRKLLVALSAYLTTLPFILASEPVDHVLRSNHQSAPTKVRVLLPDRLPGDDEERLSVVYLLPVEAGETVRWGDSLAEVQQHDLHNSHHVICVFPTFADLPWYADHPENQQLQQERYLLQDVLPLIEGAYPARHDRDGRLLAGFSKSGHGAWSLMLRHPDIFCRAAAFDAPMMMEAPGKYGSGPIFGTADNFQNYRITSLLERLATDLQQERSRLMLIGEGNFQQEHMQIHKLLESSGIPHTWSIGTPRDHSWHSGWLAEAFEWLTKDLP